MEQTNEKQKKTFLESFRAALLEALALENIPGDGEEARKRAQVRKGEVRAYIYTLDNPKERAVLLARYLGLDTWENIGERFGYDESTVRKIARRALDNLQ